MDPQANATIGCGIEKTQTEHTICDVLLDEKNVEDVLVTAPEGGFALLPSNEDLTLAEVRLLQEIGREMRLRQALASIKNTYDFVLIDCPPSLGFLTLNSLAASDEVLVPLQCEFYALEGLSHLIRIIERVKKDFNPALEMRGIILTM